MAQITHTKLKELNVIQLYEHYGALERSLPLLTPESQDLARAELEACITLRSEKIDRIYYAMAAHEDAVERIKKEKGLILKAQKHHESQVDSLKHLLNYLKRVLPVDANKITGRNYQFTLVKKKDLTVEIKSNPEFWSSEERQHFCVEEEVTTTKRTVLRSMSGEILSERIEPSNKTNVLPNLDAIRSAHQAGQLLPQGVKVFQEYSIRSSRIYGKSSVDLASSEYPRDLLPEDRCADEC
jgi:hypothetical protein